MASSRADENVGASSQTPQHPQSDRAKQSDEVDLSLGSEAFAGYSPIHGKINGGITDDDIEKHDLILTRIFQDLQESARAHLIAVKKRMLDERLKALSEANEAFNHRLEEKDKEISKLKDTIISRDGDATQLEGLYDFIAHKASIALLRNRHRYKGEFSLSKIFDAWRRVMLRGRDVKRLEKITGYLIKRNTKTQTFLCMNRNYHQRTAQNIRVSSAAKFNTVTNDLVRRYEAELASLRAELREAYATASREQRARLQLEEDLRRMFLKNMTTMNFEALELFNNSHFGPEAVGSIDGGSDPAVSVGDRSEFAAMDDFSTSEFARSHNIGALLRAGGGGAAPSMQSSMSPAAAAAAGRRGISFLTASASPRVMPSAVGPEILRSNEGGLIGRQDSHSSADKHTNSYRSSPYPTHTAHRPVPTPTPMPARPFGIGHTGSAVTAGAGGAGVAGARTSGGTSAGAAGTVGVGLGGSYHRQSPSLAAVHGRSNISSSISSSISSGVGPSNHGARPPHGNAYRER